MSLVFIVTAVSLVLVACHPGNASVLRPSPEGPVDSQSPTGIRCLTDPLQHVRKVILDSLNLQTKPDVFVPGMAQIREYWKTIFQGTKTSNPGEQLAAENAPSSPPPPPSSSSSSLLSSSLSSSSSSLSSSFSRSGNSSHPQCCMFATQIFIKDLGWDTWIIYPESFTFVQCSPVCVPQPNRCADDDTAALAPSTQKPCCQATSHDIMPFLYMDETSTLIISSIPLIRGCSCRHGDSAASLQP